MTKVLLAIAASLIFAGAVAAQTVPVEIKDAWARATPGKAVNGAAYFTVQSPGGDTLTGASTPVADKAELHEMEMSGNVMKMRPVGPLNLPAGKPVILKPGGIHVMLLGLKQPLQAGQTFPLTLDFAKAGPRQVSVTVEKVGAMGMSSGGMPMQH
jgi:copper(I)-binding protein